MLFPFIASGLKRCPTREDTAASQSEDLSYAENIFGIQRYTSLPSGDGKCVETTQGTTDGASRAAILQRFSPDNKSFDRPGTASMRHTSKASEGILSSLREMNDSTSCYHAMTAVCHGCTAIDEILQSWLYIHHRRTAIDEVLLS